MTWDDPSAATPPLLGLRWPPSHPRQRARERCTWASPVQAGYLELPGPATRWTASRPDRCTARSRGMRLLAGSSFSGTFLYVDGRGTLRGTSHGTQQPPAGTTMPFTDTITITNGTGAYRGAHGTLTSQGSGDISRPASSPSA